MDDDQRFDRWLKHFQDKVRRQQSKTGGRTISKEEYLSKYAKVIGGESA